MFMPERDPLVSLLRLAAVLQSSWCQWFKVPSTAWGEAEHDRMGCIVLERPRSWAPPPPVFGSISHNICTGHDSACKNEATSRGNHQFKWQASYCAYLKWIDATHTSIVCRIMPCADITRVLRAWKEGTRAGHCASAQPHHAHLSALPLTSEQDYNFVWTPPFPTELCLFPQEGLVFFGSWKGSYEAWSISRFSQLCLHLGKEAIKEETPHIELFEDSYFDLIINWRIYFSLDQTTQLIASKKLYMHQFIFSSFTYSGLNFSNSS